MITRDLLVPIIEFFIDMFQRVIVLFTMISDFFTSIPDFFAWIPSDILGFVVLLLITAITLRLVHWM